MKGADTPLFPFEQAAKVAEKVVNAVAPYCMSAVIAGSLRRGRDEVHDVDIVLQPSEVRDLLSLIGAVNELNELPHFKPTGKMWQILVDGIHVDLYLATEETWATTLLVRTGSAQHNIWLAERAKARGLKLKADGTGIVRGEERVAWRSEEEIFAALGLDYIPPDKRERP